MPIKKGYLTAKTDKASDEVYTPTYAVEPIVKYLKEFNPNATVWCPFDMEHSEYVKVFKQHGFNVIHSHIDEGQNFFYYEPEEDYDVIISNPPFSQKDNVLKRLYELDKPYAMLLPIPSLQGQARFPWMKDGLQFLGFDKRINYYTNQDLTQVQKGVSFGSCYLCKKFLPRDLILEELEID
jgi:hypothetical protein